MFIARISVLLYVIGVLLAGTANAGELLYYRHWGAYSPYQFAEVTIDTDGNASLAYKYLKDDEQKTTIKLTKEEIAKCREAIIEAHFMTSKATDVPAFDVGKTIIRATLDGKTREVQYGHITEFRPIEAFAWLVLHQALVLRNLEKNGDVYGALSSLVPDWASQKILQPRVLLAPLQKVVRSTENAEKLKQALIGLSWLMTAEDWISLTKNELKSRSGKARDTWRKLLIDNYVFDTIPKTHFEALKAVWLLLLREDYPKWDSQTPQERVFSIEIVMRLGDDYTPTFLEINPAATLLYFGQNCWRYGYYIINPERIDLVRELLSDKRAKVRAAAAEFLGLLVHYGVGFTYNNQVLTGVGSTYNNHLVTEADFNTAFSHVSQALPVLQKLSKEDRDPSVKAAAKDAIEKIEKKQSEMK